MNRLRRRAPEARTADTDEVEDSLSDYSEDTVGTASEEEEEEEEEEGEDIGSEEEDDEDEDINNINELNDTEDEEALGTSNTEEDDSEVTTSAVKPKDEKPTRAFLPSARGRPARGRGGRGRYRGGRRGISTPSIHPAKRRGTGKPVTNRFRSTENAFEERQKVRNEYRRQLAEDPSFVPHIGSFWGHDDRFMPDGLRNRPRGSRGQFRGGRGFYGGRGAPRRRGYGAIHTSITRAEQHFNENASRRAKQSTPISDKSAGSKVAPVKKSSTVKGDSQSVAASSESTAEQKPTAANTLPTLNSINTVSDSGAEKKQWDHDGYAELERENQEPKKKVHGPRDRKPPLMATSFRGTGRGRPFRGRGSRGSAPWRGGVSNGFRGQRRGGFRGSRGMEREPIERLPPATKPDQQLYKPRLTRDIQTTKSTTTDTVSDTEQVKESIIVPGRQIRFGNVVNVTLSGTSSIIMRQQGATKFSTHSLSVTNKSDKPITKTATKTKEITAESQDVVITTTTTTTDSIDTVAHPPGPTAEVVANAGMAAAAANAVQSTKTSAQSVIAGVNQQQQQLHHHQQHQQHHHTIMTMMNSTAGIGPTGTGDLSNTGINATVANAASATTTTSPVVYLYTTPSGLTIPITEGSSYPMLAQHGPPAIHGHHHPHHPMSLSHHRTSSQVSVPLPQPILVQTANGLVVPVTPVSATGAGASGAGAPGNAGGAPGSSNAVTGGNPSVGGYYTRPMVGQYPMSYPTNIDPNHPSYMPYPGAVPLFVPPNSAPAPTGNPIYYNHLPYSPTITTTAAAVNDSNNEAIGDDGDPTGMPAYYYVGHGIQPQPSVSSISSSTNAATVNVVATNPASYVTLAQRRTSSTFSSTPSVARITPPLLPPNASSPPSLDTTTTAQESAENE